MKTIRWRSVVCVLLVSLMVSGAFTLWLVTRAPADTDPTAPFQDLADRKKARIIHTVEKELSQRNYIGFWHGETPPETIAEYPVDPMRHGIRYYGTFSGYDIILVPIYMNQLPGGHRVIGGYHFWCEVVFQLYAYKDDTLVHLTDAYEDRLLTKAQIAQIHQCFEQYNQEIYCVTD